MEKIQICLLYGHTPYTPKRDNQVKIMKEKLEVYPSSLCSKLPPQNLKTLSKIVSPWGAWVAQFVKHLTPCFGSGHNVRVVRWSPMLGFMLSREFAWDSLSPSAPPPSKKNVFLTCINFLYSSYPCLAYLTFVFIICVLF